MKKFLKWLLVIVCLCGIVIVIYKVFFDVEKFNTIYGREFTLKKYEVAKVSDEVTIKLMSIKDDRCTNNPCEKTNELYAKLLVNNNSEIRYITLSTVSNRNELIERMDNLNIELIDLNESSVTLRTNKIKKETR